jgi:hypothetical protein
VPLQKTILCILCIDVFFNMDEGGGFGKPRRILCALSALCVEKIEAPLPVGQRGFF